jgi:hypothetical protein
MFLLVVPVSRVLLQEPLLLQVMVVAAEEGLKLTEAVLSSWLLQVEPAAVAAIIQQAAAVSQAALVVLEGELQGVLELLQIMLVQAAAELKALAELQEQVVLLLGLQEAQEQEDEVVIIVPVRQEMAESVVLAAEEMEAKQAVLLMEEEEEAELATMAVAAEHLLLQVMVEPAVVAEAHLMSLD